ncbi:MAG: hypothetical protein U9N61_00460, partial [Euryarchaeota archaeon]|nr:hypothetical protein [Euryarchaeota archaeon]
RWLPRRVHYQSSGTNLRWFPAGIGMRIMWNNRFIPNEEIPYIFGASDVVLFPHYHEDRSVSGSIHLAIGAKKPVIAYRMPKFEDVKNISDELPVLPDNTTGIAKTAIRLFTDKEFEQYILDRTEQYRRATSWPVTVRKHLRLYLGVD